jgi:hypothetical protein
MSFKQSEQFHIFVPETILLITIFNLFEIIVAIDARLNLIICWIYCCHKCIPFSSNPFFSRYSSPMAFSCKEFTICPYSWKDSHEFFTGAFLRSTIGLHF